jgi:Leucine-rich repeat (LRR) protein
MPATSPRAASRQKLHCIPGRNPEHGRINQAKPSGKSCHGSRLFGVHLVSAVLQFGAEWSPAEQLTALFAALPHCVKTRNRPRTCLRHRSKLEMLNLSHNRIEHIKGLSNLANLIVLNLGACLRSIGATSSIGFLPISH